MENRSTMMTRAHEMTRAARETWPGIDYRATLAAALRELWSETRTETARNLGVIRLTIAAVLQHAEDVTAARTPAPYENAESDAARRAEEARAEAEAAQKEYEARKAAEAEQQQPQTLEEFFAAPGELQIDMIRRLATRCPDRAMNRTRAAVDPETGERLFNENGEQMREFIRQTWAAWMTPRKRGGLGLVPFAEAVEEVTVEAWMILQRINPDPDAQEAAKGIEWGRKKPLKVKDGEPLGLTLARAADLACYHLDRQHRDRPGFYAGDPASLDDPDFHLAASYPSPEPAALNRAEIESYARSPEDLFTVKMTAAGYNHLEIAGGAKDNPKQLAAVAAVMDLDPRQMKTGLGVSRQAVEKKFKKMTARRERARLEEAADRLDSAVMQAAGIKATRPRPRTWTPDNASTGSSTGSSAAAAALYTGSTPAPLGRPQAAQERPQAEPMTRSTGSSAAAQDAAQAAETAAEAARREAVATRSLAKLAARQARSAARSR